MNSTYLKKVLMYKRLKLRRSEQTSTVTPRNTGRQGTNKFHLLWADFRYCQYKKLKEMT